MKNKSSRASLQQQREQSADAKAVQRSSISPEDLEAWQEALQGLNTAQGIYNFIAGRLVRKYGITPADEIRADGTIARGVRSQGVQPDITTRPSEPPK